jgi:hypothetical protein
MAGSAALIPHVVVKWIIHGAPLDTGYEDRFFWTSPRLWQVGFATEHGTFLWTPVLLLAVAGLVLLWARERRLAGSLLLVFLAFYYTVASYENWHGQSSFGSRFFVSLTPVFVLGLAAFLDRGPSLLVWRPRGRGGSASAVLTVCVVLLVLWNAGLIFQWGTKLLPNRGGVDVRAAIRNQVTVVPGQLAWFLGRYMADRERVIREVEREDLAESTRYQVQR